MKCRYVSVRRREELKKEANRLAAYYAERCPHGINIEKDACPDCKDETLADEARDFVGDLNLEETQ